MEERMLEILQRLSRIEKLEGDIIDLISTVIIMSREQHDFLTVETPEQTVFTLTQAATQVLLSTFFINGVKQVYGSQYSISGTTLTYAGAAVLQPVDTLEIIYHY